LIDRPFRLTSVDEHASPRMCDRAIDESPLVAELSNTNTREGLFVTGLLERDVLVISQEAKLIEMNNEYRILDPEGVEVGAIRQEGQSKTKKLFRLLGDVDQFLTHRLSVYEADGTKLLEILRPAKILKSSIQIRDAGGASRGAIDQENVVGKKRFALRGPGGEALGSIDADNWRSWDFAVHDARGAEIARVTKEWAGFLREGLTTADHYVLEITGPTSSDLRFLLVASAAALDTALKQDDVGGWGFGGLDLGT
jgi:uncharacterized protein YxjI